MTIEFHPNFRKAYKKRIARNKKLKDKTEERIELFRQNPRSPILDDHPLSGSKKGMRSISVTGDIRIIYRKISDNDAIFLNIGSHSQIY